MSLEDIIQVQITAQTTTVSRLGFGTPLIARLHSVYPQLVREYKSLKAMTDDGWSVLDPAYLMATKIASQNPKPASWKIGKRSTAFTQIVRLTPIKVTTGYVYTFDVIVAGVTTTITYTNPPASTVASIVTALTALITAVVGITAVDAVTHVTVTTDTAGALVDYVGASDEPANLGFKTVTTDPGLAADLSAIEAVDPDGWYALLLDSNSEAEINAGAAWIEARKKIFLCETSDTEVVDVGVTTDIMSDLQGFSYARTAIAYSQARLLNWTGAAWAGNRLPFDPGSTTWAFKTLAAVQVDTTLTGSHITVVEGKKGNVYRVIAGVPVTTFGITAAGEYIDVTQFIDWLDARIKERIFGVLVNNAKIPYTDAGVDLMRSQVLAQLNQGIAAGGLAADPAPVVTAPKVADIDPADKANRILPDIFFQATLAGAIHQLQISGVLSV
jgi:hypothetical protein